MEFGALTDELAYRPPTQSLRLDRLEHGVVDPIELLEVGWRE